MVSYHQSSLLSPACWESPGSGAHCWGTPHCFSFESPWALSLCGLLSWLWAENVGRIRDETPMGKCFPSHSVRAPAAKITKILPAAMKHTGLPAPGRQHSLVVAKESLALGAPAFKLSGRGEGRERKLASVSTSKNQG